MASYGIHLYNKVQGMSLEAPIVRTFHVYFMSALYDPAWFAVLLHQCSHMLLYC